MQVLIGLHGLIRWAVLILGVWIIVKAISGVQKKSAFTAADDKRSLFFMISCDVQFLIGMILYFTGPFFAMLKANPSMVMKTASIRFFAVEHITMMLLAWILVHIGRSAVKKAATDEAKHKKALMLFGIAMLIILASIPWPFREEIARPLFPAMN